MSDTEHISSPEITPTAASAPVAAATSGACACPEPEPVLQSTPEGIHAPGFKRMLARSIGSVAAVLAILVLTLVGLSAIFDPKNNTQEAGMFNYKSNSILGEHANTIDVLMVGDSAVYTSVSNLEMYNECGFTAFPVARPGQVITYSSIELAHALENQSPKVVLFETDGLFAGVYVSDCVLYTLADWFPILQYHSRWKDLQSSDFTESVHYTWTDPLKNARIERTTLAATDSAIQSYNKRTNTTSIEELYLVNRAYIYQMVEMVRAAGATPVFYSAPSIGFWSENRHDIIQEIADELDMDYIDLNMGDTQFEIDWKTETADGGKHVNQAGLERLSPFFARLLDEKYDLPDHRNDSDYAAWSAAYEYYLELRADGQNHDVSFL